MAYKQGFPITPGSLAVNGELVGTPMNSLFMPTNAPGPSFRGGPRQPATIPTGVGAQLGLDGTTGSSGTATRGNTALVAGAAIVIGLLGLRYIHWRR